MSLTQVNNLTPLQRVASGDRSAMEDCLQRYSGLIWKIVAPRCASRSDAEDLVQEIFLTLWRSADRFDPEVAQESTFIAMIARRRLVDSHRRRGRRVATTPFEEGAEPACESFTCPLEISDEAKRARAMLSELKREEREVLTLAIDDGLTQVEIAERTDQPLGTVKTRARRGLQRLRELLSGEQAQGGRND